ncbi:hypothetical protein BVRB_3g048700 isoform B [Beta vulgaris subsp. vulgaris]|nr:hypothetical protein BVRB_3g048700 isoform B [Beta vulgaris subsp. vulgaris]
MSCFKCGTSSGNVNASSFSGFNITSNMQAALTDQVDVAINDTTSAEDFDALHDWMDNQLADLAKHDHNDVDGYLSLQDNNKDTVSQDVTGLDFQISSLHDSDDDHHDDHTMDHNFIREVELRNVDFDTSKGRQLFEPEQTSPLDEDQQGATCWKVSKKRDSEQRRRKRISDKLQVLDNLVPHSHKMMLGWQRQSQLQQASYATQTFVPMMMTDMQFGAVNSSGITRAQPIYQMPISPTLYQQQPPNFYHPSTTASFEQPTFCPPTTRQLPPHF